METKGYIEKYRPRLLFQVMGQEVSVKEIAKRSKEGTLRQNILISGMTGTGKTVLGRIIAKMLSCKNPLVSKANGIEYFEPCGECATCQAIDDERTGRDYHFYDGSKMGKDEVNSIKDLCDVMPLFSKTRIIHIDEIQNIASGKDSSLQALLKLIEKDYKGRVHFIMSTMDLARLPKSVVDRFQMHLRLKPLSVENLLFLGKSILEAEGIFETIDFNFLKEGMLTLAESSNGCAREFVGHLEDCVYKEVYSTKDIVEELNIVSPKYLEGFIRKLLHKDAEFFKDVRELYSKNLGEFFEQTHTYLSDLLLFRVTGTTNYPWQQASYMSFNSVPNESLMEILDHYNKVSSYPYFKYSIYYQEMSSFFLSKKPKEKVLLAENKEEPIPRRQRRERA